MLRVNSVTIGLDRRVVFRFIILNVMYTGMMVKKGSCHYKFPNNFPCLSDIYTISIVLVLTTYEMFTKE